MQILSFLGNSENVRFSYPLSLRPWFEFAGRKHLANTPAAKGRVQFVADGEVGLLAQDMALLLGMTNRFPTPDARKPFERQDEATEQRFDYEVMFPPDNAILDLSNSGRAVKRRDSQAIAIDDAIRNAHGRAILLVSGTTLSRRVGDTAIAKARLVRSRRVQAVLAVPGGMLGKHVGRDCDLLVLAPTAEPAQTIRFLNLGHPDLATSSPRGQKIAKREVDWNAFVEGQPNVVGNAEYFNEVSYDEVNDSEFLLSPARQILSPSKKTVDAFLSRARKERLSDLVTFTRPRALPVADEGHVQVREAGIHDIREDGFLSRPAKAIWISTDDEYIAARQSLRENDVVFAIKGRVGAVGVVPPDYGQEDTEAIWSASQSLMILRPGHRHANLHLIIYSYLTHPIVQAHIATMVTGTTSQTISQTDIENIWIPLPDKRQTAVLAEKFADRVRRYDAIDMMRQELAREKLAVWPLIDAPVEIDELNPADLEDEFEL